MGATHYFGKVCLRHPELKGERTTQHWCVGCRLETDRRRRKNPARLERNKLYLRALRQRPEYAARQSENDRRRKSTAEHREWERAYKNRPERLAQRRTRYANEVAFALKVKSQTRIYNTLAGREKAARTLELLGVPSIEFYKSYLRHSSSLG